MTRWACAVLFTVILTPVLSTPALGVGDNEEIAELWDRYILEIGRRDEMQTLTCYGEYVYRQLCSDRTSAGRARLSTHMGEMFDLLARSYDYEIIKEEESGSKVIYTLQFTHRKKKAKHNSTVEFAQEDGEWRIIKPPEGPGFLKPEGGSFKMIAGIVVALAGIVFIAKKMLG